MALGAGMHIFWLLFGCISRYFGISLEFKTADGNLEILLVKFAGKKWRPRVYEYLRA